MKNSPYTLHPVRRWITVEALVAIYDEIRPRNFDFSGEMHDFWELVCVLDGEAIATADERIYTLRRGQALLHRPMEFHRIRTTADSEAHLLLLSFQAAGDGMPALAGTVFPLGEQELHQLQTVGECFKQVQALLSGGRPEPALRRAETVAAVEMERFLLSAEARMPATQMPLTRPQQADTYEAVIRYMQAHIAEPLTLQQLAHGCRLSPSTLKRVFALYCDRSVMAYFRSMKIRCARQLLEQGKTIQAVSRQLGFSEVTYFHTVFKRETGLPPGQFRRQYTPKERG